MTMPPPPKPVNGLAPYHTVSDFHADARAMRGDVERFFADPADAGPPHQVWSYRHVPGRGTCLRTQPEQVIERGRVEAFVQRLRTYAWQNYGLSQVTWPSLNLYVEGCGESIHEESHAGAFGYAYSLTPWERRRFSGGETQILREQDDRRHSAATPVHDLIEMHFNQLLAFDARLIHGVPPLRGAADPLDGCLVLQGHLQVNGISAGGPLDAVFQRSGIGSLGEVLAQVQADLGREAGRYHGFATLAVNVLPSGEVHSVTRLVQRVLAREGLQLEVPVLDALAATLTQLRFPRADGPSRVVVPVLFS